MNFVRLTRLAAVLIASACVLASATLPSEAANGTVRIRITKVGFIIGGGGGSGVLHFKGRNYPFRVSGMSAGTIGISHMDLIGTASNLQSPTDLAGSYSGGSASVAVAGGAKVARLQNEKGVVLEVHGAQAGLELSLNVGGATITMP
jgi:lipid-binding SYLF domain-containing protein